MSRTYDVVIIGAGAAGSTAAFTALQEKVRVALIEQDRLGGTCLNYGCDPTKTLLHIAHLLYEAHHSDQYGLDIPLVRANWPQVLERVKKTQKKIRGGNREEAREDMQEKGIDLYLGEARFLSPHELAVAGQTLRAEQVIIATGARAVVPPIPGLKETGYITNIEAVSLPEVPERLGVIGGGPLGVEFAQIFSRFGAEVTILEEAPQILPGEEPELVETLTALLEQEGIRIRTEAEAQRFELSGTGKQITFQWGEGQQERLEVDEILLATGRRPVLDGLNLAAAGVEADEEGIVTDETLRTSVPHIWAAGDVTTKYPFTHVVSVQGALAARNALAEKPEAFDDSVIPWVTYTYPALAHVGKTEAQLREAGTPHQVLKTELEDVSRAVHMGQTQGGMKLLVAPEGQVLGGHILAPHAGELLAPLIVAMKAGVSVAQLAELILPYPTLSRILSTTAGKADAS